MIASIGRPDTPWKPPPPCAGNALPPTGVLSANGAACGPPWPMNGNVPPPPETGGRLEGVVAGVAGLFSAGFVFAGL